MSSFLKNKNLSYKESHYYYFADEETEPQKTICLKVTTEERGSTQKKKIMILIPIHLILLHSISIQNDLTDPD